MVCGKCGSEQYSETSAFCFSCGAKLAGGDFQMIQTEAPFAALPGTAPAFYGANAYSAVYEGAIPKKTEKKLVVLVVILGVLMLLMSAAYTLFMAGLIYNNYRTLPAYADACLDAQKVYDALKEEMDLGSSGTTDYFYRQPKGEKLALYMEVLNGGEYDCGTDGSGVQGIIYSTLKNSGSKNALNGRVYVGFDRGTATLFVQWQSEEENGVIAQYPDESDYSDMDKLEFGKFRSSYQGGDYYDYDDYFDNYDDYNDYDFDDYNDYNDYGYGGGGRNEYEPKYPTNGRMTEV